MPPGNTGLVHAEGWVGVTQAKACVENESQREKDVERIGSKTRERAGVWGGVGLHRTM